MDYREPWELLRVSWTTAFGGPNIGVVEIKDPDGIKVYVNTYPDGMSEEESVKWILTRGGALHRVMELVRREEELRQCLESKDIMIRGLLELIENFRANVEQIVKQGEKNNMKT